MRKNALLASVSALALIVAGCNADTGDNLGYNNDTSVENVVEDNGTVTLENETTENLAAANDA